MCLQPPALQTSLHNSASRHAFQALFPLDKFEHLFYALPSQGPRARGRWSSREQSERIETPARPAKRHGREPAAHLPPRHRQNPLPGPSTMPISPRFPKNALGQPTSPWAPFSGPIAASATPRNPGAPWAPPVCSALFFSRASPPSPKGSTYSSHQHLGSRYSIPSRHPRPFGIQGLLAPHRVVPHCFLFADAQPRRLMAASSRHEKSRRRESAGRHEALGRPGRAIRNPHSESRRPQLPPGGLRSQEIGTKSLSPVIHPPHRDVIRLPSDASSARGGGRGVGKPDARSAEHIAVPGPLPRDRRPHRTSEFTVAQNAASDPSTVHV